MSSYNTGYNNQSYGNTATRFNSTRFNATGTRVAGQYDPCDPCPPAPGGGIQTRQVVEDYTNQGPVRLEDTDIFARAVNVSQAVPVDGGEEAPVCGTYRQKVIRRVEVPYTRKVKVATTTTKLVEGTEKQRVMSKKLIQVPSFKTVDEEYTVFEEREAVREKEVWVKQIVPEKYIERVPVKKVRQVQKPSTEIRQVEEWVEVDVPVTKCVEVDGFRIDDVEDTKMVEVEEYQEMQFKPEPVGQPVLSRTREVGRIPGQHLSRNVGLEVYDKTHQDLVQLDLDSNPASQGRQDRGLGDCICDDNGNLVRTGEFSAQRSVQYQTGTNGQAAFSNTARGYRGQSDYRASGTQSSVFATSTYTDPKFIRPAGDFQKQAVSQVSQSMTDRGSIGMSVKNTHTRHTDGTGVMVTRVEPAGCAAVAGVKENDIITSANGQPTITVDHFAAVVKGTQGPVTLNVNRDGRRNIQITLNR